MKDIVSVEQIQSERRALLEQLGELEKRINAANVEPKELLDRRDLLMARLSELSMETLRFPSEVFADGKEKR